MSSEPPSDQLTRQAPRWPLHRPGVRRVAGVHPAIWVPAVLVAVAMLLPVLYLVLATVELPPQRIWTIATDPATLRLAGRTLLLGAAVTLASLLIGVPLA